MGAKRIVKAIAIPHPVGNPKLSSEKEHEVRKEIVESAMNLLTKAVGDMKAIVE